MVRVGNAGKRERKPGKRKMKEKKKGSEKGKKKKKRKREDMIKLEIYSKIAKKTVNA